MKNISISFWNWFKKHKVWSVIIILIVLGLIWYIVGPKKTVTLDFVLAGRGNIQEQVSATGNIKPLSSVELAFERGGRVAGLSVAVGDRVYKGQQLAFVSNADLVANLAQAEASLKIAELQLGNRTDKLNLDINQTRDSLINTIKNSHTKADDALRNKLYSLFNDPLRYNAKLIFTTDSFLQEDIENNRNTVSDVVDSWRDSLVNLGPTSNLEDYYKTAKNNLILLGKMADQCAEAVNSLTTEEATSIQIDTWKLNVSTARTNIDLTVSSLDASYNQYQSALLAGGNYKTDLSVQAVTIDQARAGVDSALAELAKSLIKSPIDGVITSINLKFGEIVPASRNVISVISYGEYEVESFIPEADIAKIKISNLASTTLDAYGSNVNFETKVIKIDPAATIIDGVPTYKVTLKFTEQDERIRSGMTANLDILTNQKDNVLILPSRVIVTESDGKYVSVLGVNNKTEIIDKKIVTGLRGADGNVEIVSGLSEGDMVVTQ
jgi:HlyD family secretion protein